MKRIFLISILLLVAHTSFSQLNTNHVMHTGRSRLYFGNYTGAIESFNMIIRMQPHLPEPYFYRGAAKLNLDDYRGALTDLNKALDIKPFYPEALLYRGMVYYHLNEFEKAMADYTEALTYDNDNADIFNNRGICKAAMRDFDGAIEDYSRSITLKPRNYNAYLNRSIAYQITEQSDKAIDDTNQLIRIRPNSPMGYMSRGLIRVEKEDFASALRDFDMAIYLDPQNAFAYQNRGMVKQQLGSYEAAIMDYNAAIELNNRMASAYFNRGIAKEMLGIPGYIDDYNYASVLDSRFANRPWLTREEQEEARQQQMLAWYNPQPDDEPQDESSSETESQTIVEEESENELSIDVDNLRKRRMLANLALEDTRNLPGSDPDEEIPVQDRIINIDLRPMFVVAALNQNTDGNETYGYFNLLVEKLNAEYNYNPYMTITNKTSLAASRLDYYNNQVLILNQLINQNNQISNNFLLRGIFSMLTANYELAISDFDKALELNEENLLAYFMRANTRFRIIETIESFSVSGTLGLSAVSRPLLSATDSENRAQNEAFNDIFTDYSVALFLDPQFAYAYYNRGNIYVRNENYLSALDEYNKAINAEPDFAEAYFNRGLVRILLNDTENGAKDLSKAGELGIVESYNVIKRYCN